MAVTTKEQLKQYALRALGAPVVEINVDDDQLEDRLEEAVEYWRVYHPDGVEKLYMKHVISASELRLTTNNADQFPVSGIVTGATSGATAVVTTETSRLSSGNMVLVKNVKGTFVPGETVTVGTVTATLGTPAVVLGSYDKRYIEIPDLVYGITRVLPFSQASSSKNLFDLQYQLRLNDLYDLTSTSIIYYKTVMSHLALLDLELNGHPQFRFNRRQSKLFLDMNWESDVALGDFIVIECYRALDPTENVKVWDDSWLKHYVTALFKKQWAVNIKKFQGIQLVGGVTLDGNALYDEATGELKELEDELQNKSAPLEFFLG
jgi:hypothetical protein